MALPKFPYEGYVPADDSYESANFKIHATPSGQFMNLMLEGYPVNEATDVVWVTLHDNELDELITALSYYREYRTFKPKEA